MKKGDQWMPLYIGDYLADTSRLTTEQHGAYLLLLMDYWRNGAPPDDDTVLASIARLPLKVWRVHRAAILPMFKIVDGKWTQKRADEERNRAQGIVSDRSAAGKKGAEARWGDKQNDGKRIASAMANASQTPSQTDGPSPSPLQTTESKALVPDESVTNPKPEARDTAPDCPHDQIIELYHRELPMLRQIREWNEQRKTLLRSRWRENPERQTLDFWRDFFRYVAKCPLLVGNHASERHPGWQADLEWLVRPSNFVKVIEGKYEPAEVKHG